MRGGPRERPGNRPRGRNDIGLIQVIRSGTSGTRQDRNPAGVRSAIIPINPRLFLFPNGSFCKKHGQAWLAAGSVTQAAIPAPPYLRLVAPHAPPLGAALIR